MAAVTRAAGISTNRRAFEATGPTHGAQIARRADGARKSASAALTARQQMTRTISRPVRIGRAPPTSNSARIRRPALAAEEVRQRSCRFRARTRTGFVSVSRAAAVPPRRYSMPQLHHTRLALGRFAPPPWAQNWMRHGMARSQAARPRAPSLPRAGPARTFDCGAAGWPAPVAQASAPRRLSAWPPHFAAGFRFPCARVRRGAGDRFGSSARALRSPALFARPGRKEVAAFRSGQRYKRRPRLLSLPPRPRQI